MNSIFTSQTAHLVERMSNEEYHSRPEFSSSQLKDLLRSGAHFYAKNIAKEVERESKPAMDFGTLAHTLFLEPDQFHNEFVIAPKFDRRTKEGKADAAAWEAANQGKIGVTAEQVKAAERVVRNLQTLGIYKEMQDNYGLAEASIFFVDPEYGLQLRIRPDFYIAPCKKWPNGLIIDLKTTSDARPNEFSRTCGKFAYDLSAAMYCEGFQQYYQTEEKPPFFFAVAENDVPYNVKQYKASDLFLAVGHQRYTKAKEQLANSLLLDEWNGYSPDLEEIFLPSYLTNQALHNI